MAPAPAGLILDCDGVLVDSEPLSNRALAETLTELGLPFTPEDSTREFMGRSWSYVESRLDDLMDGGTPPGLRERYLERMFAAFAADLGPVPGVAAALDAIDLPACVASSGEHEKMRYTLGLCGLLDRFDGRLFSATEVEHGKPAPDLFLHAARSMGWPASACVVVEDSPTGIEAGVAAGMRTLGYAERTDPGALAGAGASTVFADMAALPALLAPA
jgi:HAD superfamily hydrolase (TIGR01509 family)